ncbi:MAG: DinB family protein [Gemmatimonadota bacterium]
MTDRRLDEAIRHLHPPAGARPWHGGPTVLGALRGVTPEQASWKPLADRHSIWELALHVAYWNYAVERRITGAPRGGFPRSPSNWPRPGGKPSLSAWEEDRGLVRECHDSLVEVLSAFDPSRLDLVAGGKANTTYADLITGIMLHDTYHAGQIQILKRLGRAVLRRPRR